MSMFQKYYIKHYSVCTNNYMCMNYGTKLIGQTSLPRAETHTF